MAAPETVQKGLEGVVASRSAICKIESERGVLWYRGYNVNDLADHSSFEEVAYLLVHGRLPTRPEFKEFLRKWGAWRRLTPGALKRIKSFSSRGSDPMDALRTAVSLLGAEAKGKGADETTKALSLAAKFPTILAAHARFSRGQRFTQAPAGMRHGAAFMTMLNGAKPTDLEARVIDLDFILSAEHEFNASTFACRLTASTLSDVHSALCSAIGTLKGPLHGGARAASYNQFEAIGSPDNVAPWVESTLAAKKKVMGWGHRIYRTTDPRALVFKKWARRLSEEKGSRAWYDIADRLERALNARPEFREKRIYANVDFYPPISYKLLGIGARLGNAVFAIGRSVGWVAHYLEQRGDNRLIRPVAQYTGPLGLSYVPIEKR